MSLSAEITARRAACSSCNAPVLWVTTDAGKMMPVDAEPRADGNVAVVGAECHAYDMEDAMRSRPRFVSHFATCPDAPRWRRADQAGGVATSEPTPANTGRRSGGGMRCRVNGCTRTHRDDQVACYGHWTALPAPMRQAIWQLYRSEPGSKSHVKAVYDAIAWLDAREGARPR